MTCDITGWMRILHRSDAILETQASHQSTGRQIEKIKYLLKLKNFNLIVVYTCVTLYTVAQWFYFPQLFHLIVFAGLCRVVSSKWFDFFICKLSFCL